MLLPLLESMLWSNSAPQIQLTAAAGMYCIWGHVAAFVSSHSNSGYIGHLHCLLQRSDYNLCFLNTTFASSVYNALLVRHLHVIEVLPGLSRQLFN